jgi:23S rRNA-/tRNA-specific pseudouridylate synthase
MEYLVLHRFAAYTLVEPYAKTGRRPIRVHLYRIGHPVHVRA